MESSRAAPSEQPWQQWIEKDWNTALFEHYFCADEDDVPVTRLVVTGRELTQAAGCEREEADVVERSFVAVIRRPPDSLNVQFQRAFLATPSFEEPPAAVLYLLFSCYIASGNEQVINVGDFRRRMAKVLGHPPGTSYPLEGLAALWEGLQRWLTLARSAGCAYRELVLPQPDWRTRIGYSIQLAFPQRRDQMVLNEIIPTAGFAAQPPIPALIRLLGRCLDRFSDGFVEVYENFRRLFLAGHDDFSHSPLLDAVGEAMEQARPEVAAPGVYPDLRLIGEPDDQGRLMLMLLSDRGNLPARSRNLVTFETDYGIGEHRFVLAFKSPDNEGADTIIQFLLADDLAEMLPGFAVSPLHHSVGDGVLLFHHGPCGILECAPNLNVEGELRVLVRRDLCAAFERALASVVKPAPRVLASAYDDWREFNGIQAAVLRCVTWSEHPDLDDVHCLQRCALASRITLVGGVATGEPQTFFGHPVVLPAVRVHGQPAAVAMAKAGKIEPERELVPAGDGLFEIRALDGSEPLEGEFIITARTAGESNHTLRKKLRFRAFVDGHDYICPSHPEKWLCESVVADMTAWNADAVFGGARRAPRAGNSLRHRPPRRLRIAPRAPA